MNDVISKLRLVLVFVAGFLSAIVVVRDAPTLFVSDINGVRTSKPLPTSGAQPLAIKGEAVGKALPLDNIDWANNKKTLVLFLSSSCHFCIESSPFYKQLVAKYSDGSAATLVVVMPEDVSVAKEHLKRLGVGINTVFDAQLDSVGVRGTPTLLLVDGSGIVSDEWIGKLPKEKEAEVFDKLSSS
jgi:thiol-disulfide isomerase/thioredoxin